MRNNFPVDLAKEMGADIIIGSEMSVPRQLDELNSPVDLLFQTITLLSTTTEENYAELKELGAQLSQLLTGETAAPAPEAAPAEAAASKWVCSVCGYVHEGDTLPEDYKCPLCGVGPEKFIKG